MSGTPAIPRVTTEWEGGANDPFAVQPDDRFDGDKFQNVFDLVAMSPRNAWGSHLRQRGKEVGKGVNVVVEEADILDFFSQRAGKQPEAPKPSEGEAEGSGDSGSDLSSDEDVPAAPPSVVAKTPADGPSLAEPPAKGDVQPSGNALSPPPPSPVTWPPRKAHFELVEVDALSRMKSGYSFLKFGKYGKPHFRLVQLSADHGRIQWYSKRKGRSDTQVWLPDIHAVIRGQQTEIFLGQPTPTLERTSFSIVYGANNLTLDLIAKSINEFNIFVGGLEALLAGVRDRGVTWLKGLPELRMTVKRYALRIDAAGHTGDKSEPLSDEHVRIVRAEIDTYEAKLGRHTQQPEFASMKLIIQVANEDFEDAEECVRNGDYAKASHTLWRIRTDLKGLKHMMKAVKSNPADKRRGSLVAQFRRMASRQ